MNEYVNNWNPTILEDSSHGKKEVALMARHLTERRLFLIGEVTESMSDDFVSEFLYLIQEDKPINIYLNSPGGLVNAGLVIYDILQSCEGKVPVNIYCTGMAASMGAIILAGGQKGRRFILPHSRVMIHEPLISGNFGGSATSVQKKAESIIETRTITNGILAKHTGKTIEEINHATSYDNFMNAEEAVAFGICDRIQNIF